MISSSAPGRCGIVGNPTDGYGGAVISSSLAERAVVQLQPASRFELDICGHTETLADPPDLTLTQGFTDVAKAVFTRFPQALAGPPFRLLGTTTVPVQAGLSGSTCMVTAILGAVLRLLDDDRSPYVVAETVRDIEFNVMDCICGFQDQYMAAFGGLNYMDFRGKQPHSEDGQVYAAVEPLAPHVVDAPFILANTGVQRHSGTIHKAPRERWIEGDREVIEGYERTARLARAGKVAMLTGDWPRLGELMNENHAISRQLGGSGEANERLIAAALEHGAWGAKLAGAGGGGTIIALHPDPDELGRRLADAGAVRVLRVVPTAGLTVEGSL